MIIIMMAMDEKTEKPTPKKKREAREKGQVFKSKDISSVILLLGMFGYFKLFGAFTLSKLSEMVSYNLINFPKQEELLSMQNAGTFLLNVLAAFSVVLIPILAFSSVIAFSVNYFQVGFILTTKTLKPDFSRTNPVTGLKNVLSMKSLAELVKSSAKAIAIIAIAYNEIRSSLTSYSNLMNQGIVQSTKTMFLLLQRILFKIAIAVAVIAAFDYLYERWRYNKNLKMSKQEVRDEIKETEGDPKIKARIRKKQSQISMMRMMDEVPKATVIITNPTHYAVALKYEKEQEGPPVVVAKGQDYIAQKIKEKAREHNIEIVEDKPLAKALYAACEIGDAIPQEFFVAVAQILAEIYKIKKL
ncbi:MAG TPA: flagellar biosynthesis protein FlhB [Firmicutes bacterium]|jgi:flagellar biosynthetic protein FlhB|nr:flagellar biosynthesis protein FlhB [Bacillota bacterium]